MRRGLTFRQPYNTASRIRDLLSDSKVSNTYQTMTSLPCRSTCWSRLQRKTLSGQATHRIYAHDSLWKEQMAQLLHGPTQSSMKRESWWYPTYWQTPAEL